jgi:endonuclease/exonuclease/phosphatase family metal-dependent hydrolase
MFSSGLARFATKVPNTITDRILKVATFNISNAMRDEKVLETKWSNRQQAVFDLICRIDADIICLQELRNLPGEETVEQFLARFTNYRSEVAYRNPTDLSFAQAIMWKPDRVFPQQSMRQWLSQTPNQLSDSATIPLDKPSPGYLLQGIEFLFVSNGKVLVNESHGQPHPFYIFNVHMPVGEDEKNHCTPILRDRIQQITQKKPFMVCGDFNTFDDLDGPKQREVLSKAGWIDMGKHMISTTDESIVKGTFIGYMQDDHHAEDPSHPTSRLDHIWASDGRVVNMERHGGVNAWMPRVALGPGENNKSPSDHVPLSVEVFITPY